MKKTLGIVLALLIAVVVIAPKTADAQVILCAYCCDATGTPRCSGYQMPCGNACVCLGISGYGYAC